MSDPFEKMATRALARIGGAGTIRGEAAVVSIEHGIEVAGEYGEVIARRSVAIMPSASAPKPGDALVVGAKSYVIDSVEMDDGYTVQCFLRA